MAGSDWLEKDFYKILGVPQDADAATIKKTYRKLARELHPDTNAGDPNAEQKFKEIGEAYAVLSDPEKRSEYDSYRAMASGGARFAAGPGGGGAGFEDLFGGMFGGAGAAPGGAGGTRMRFSTGGGGGADFEDMLSGMFGGGFTSTRGPRAGRDVNATTSLSFRDATQGATVRLTSNGKPMTVRIPAGVRDGQKIRLRGKGAPGDAGAPSGDLVVTVKVQPHPVFSRSGRSDLRVTVPVTFGEAALGGEVAVPTLAGDSVRVKVPAGTPSGRTLRVRGRGVKAGKSGEPGDLLVTVQIVVPQRLDKDARAAVESFAAATSGDDPRADLFTKAAE